MSLNPSHIAMLIHPSQAALAPCVPSAPLLTQEHRRAPPPQVGSSPQRCWRRKRTNSTPPWTMQTSMKRNQTWKSTWQINSIPFITWIEHEHDYNHASANKLNMLATWYALHAQFGTRYSKSTSPRKTILKRTPTQRTPKHKKGRKYHYHNLPGGTTSPTLPPLLRALVFLTCIQGVMGCDTCIGNPFPHVTLATLLTFATLNIAHTLAKNNYEALIDLATSQVEQNIDVLVLTETNPHQADLLNYQLGTFKIPVTAYSTPKTNTNTHGVVILCLNKIANHIAPGEVQTHHSGQLLEITIRRPLDPPLTVLGV